MSNIAIVGFMGTGKSAVSLALSKRLNKSYVSTDELIVRREHQSIHDIFKKRGEPYFREVESEMVKEASEMDNAIVDCGGGVVMKEENIQNLKKSGPVICLAADPGVIYERVKGHRHRPLLDVPNPCEAIGQLLKERASFYGRADFTIDTNALTVEQVVDAILNFLRKRPSP